MKDLRQGLNPCFTGKWFLSSIKTLYLNDIHSLNPCFTGKWFLSYKTLYYERSY